MGVWVCFVTAYRLSKECLYRARDSALVMVSYGRSLVFSSVDLVMAISRHIVFAITFAFPDTAYRRSGLLKRWSRDLSINLS